MDWKAEDPGKRNRPDQRIPNNQGGRHRKIILRFRSQEENAAESYLQDNLYVYIPLHLSAPENVLLLIHVDGEVLVLALLDGIRPGGDGPHLVKLKRKRERGKY